MTNEHEPSIDSSIEPELLDSETAAVVDSSDPFDSNVENAEAGLADGVSAAADASEDDAEVESEVAAATDSQGAEADGAPEEAAPLALEGGPADDELFRAIEAILMVADEPVTPQLLGELLEVGPARAAALCNALNERFSEENRGFVVARVAGGYRFQSHPDLAAYVERFVLDGQAARLSAAAMETLAIVAYKQPISRAQVAAIRGVNVDGVMRTLVQRNYVAEIAVDPGPGQATLFGTTSLFLQNLGLDSIAQLPPLGDLVPGAEVMEALEASLRVDSETGRMTRGTGAGLDGNPTEVPIGLAQDPGHTLVEDATLEDLPEDEDPLGDDPIEALLSDETASTGGSPEDEGAHATAVEGLVVEDLVVKDLVVEDLVVKDLVVEDLVVDGLGEDDLTEDDSPEDGADENETGAE
jgi:segregation and condensation protein B